MFKEFMQKTVYGTSLAEWLVAVAIVLASLLLARVLLWLFDKVLRRMAQRTKTRLDDILSEHLRQPFVFGFVVAGFWFALSYIHSGAQMHAFLMKVFHVLIVLDVAWFVVRFVDALMAEYLVPLVAKTESSLDDQLLPILRKMSKYVIWILAFIIAVNNIGYDVGALLAGLGIGGLAVALAAQDLVKNLFGGFTIFMDKPFMLGERIVVSGYDGFVEEVGLRSMRIRTLDGRLVIIPNSDVASKPVENISSEPGRKISQVLNLTYDTTPEAMQRGMDLMLGIVRAHPSIWHNTADVEAGVQPPTFTAPFAVFHKFGSFSLDLRLVYHIKPGADFALVQSEVNFQLLQQFAQAGLQFAYPTQTVYTHPA